MSIEALRVPLLNANEDELTVVAVHVEEGAKVRAGELLISLESTKATTDVEAPRAGFIRRLSVCEEQRVRVGALVCYLCDEPDEALPEIAAGGGRDDVRATKKARELAERRGLDLSEVREQLGLGGIVKERDVVAFLDGQAPTTSATVVEVDVAGVGDELVIWGAGGHAKVLIDLLRAARPDVRIIGALDDGARPPAAVLGVPVIGPSSRLPELRERGVAMAAVGVGAVTHNQTRVALFSRLIEVGYRVPALIHPRACVEASARIAEGAQVFAGAVVGSDVTIARNAIVNSGVVVSHDCRVGAHSHLTPGAVLAGSVSVGENTVIGMGVTAYLGLTIGDNVVVSNGVHLIKDVPDGAHIRLSRTA